MSQLVECLVLPRLRVLSLLVDPREPSEDVISGLLTRSAAALGSTSSNLHPGQIPVIPLEELSLGYDTPPWITHPTPSPSPLTQIPTHHPHAHPHPHSHPHAHATFIPYYIPSPLGLITSTTSWRTLLSQLPHLQILKVGGMQIESLLISLGTFDDDSTNGSGGGGGGSGISGWLVPKLEVLNMRVGCTAGQFSSEVVSRLVAVVEARNPETGGGTSSSGSGSNSGFGGGWGNGWGPGVVGGGGGWGSGGNGSSTNAGAAGVKRLKSLEVQDCELGVDVESWLGRRVERVVCVDPLYNSCDR